MRFAKTVKDVLENSADILHILIFEHFLFDQKDNHHLKIISIIHYSSAAFPPNKFSPQNARIDTKMIVLIFS
jgi:hypothetical protein